MAVPQAGLPTERPLPERRHRAHPQHHTDHPRPAQQAPARRAARLDEVYRELLEALTLSVMHRANVRQRGLTEEEIEKQGYRMLPVKGRARLARTLIDRFGAKLCARVPGLYLKHERGRSWWSLAGLASLLVPVPDIQRHVVALLVRRDEAGAPERRA